MQARLVRMVFIITTLSCTKAAKVPDKVAKKTDEASEQQNSLPPKNFVHFDKDCASCHEDERPKIGHIQSLDCVGCHQYNDWSKTLSFNFVHDPQTENCESCHLRPESALRAYPNQGPPDDFVMGENYPGSGHYLGKDCSQCHQTPEEGAVEFVFSHSSPNPQACLPCHYNDGLGEHQNDPDVLFQGFGNCQQCHQNFDRSQNRNFDPVSGEDD